MSDSSSVKIIYSTRERREQDNRDSAKIVIDSVTVLLMDGIIVKINVFPFLLACHGLHFGNHCSITQTRGGYGKLKLHYTLSYNSRVCSLDYWYLQMNPVSLCLQHGKSCTQYVWRSSG